MAESDSLEALQGLQRDLLALEASQLPNIERLWIELEAQIEDLRRLLDKPGKSDASRRKLASGTLELDDVSYTVNAEFQQEAVEVADQLDLDELKAAHLLLIAQSDAEELDRPAQVGAIIRFHSERQFRLDCLRLMLGLSVNEELDDELRDKFRLYIRQCIDIETGPVTNGSRFFKKCLDDMGVVEKSLEHIATQVLGARERGLTIPRELLELLDYQTTALTQQHEILAAITTYLVKSDITTSKEMEFYIEKASKLQRHDLITVHYLPIGMALVAQLGSSDDRCNLGDARNLHKLLKNAETWAFRNFHAIILAHWLGEYSGRYIEDPRGSPVQGADLTREAEERAKLFTDAIKDGAFHFLLSVCQDIRRSDWYEPAKVDLISLLLQDNPVLPGDCPSISEYFRKLITDQVQLFAEAFITNMPDSLRRLKVEEDEQRRNLPFHIPGTAPQYEMHLERFFVIISLAYEGYPDAAQTFWEDPDGNLFGFLQWSAKRQTTPRAAAFCEMLRSIAEDSKCADAAHAFLLEEGSSAGRLRRTGSLCWSQIFAELQYYAEKIKDRSTSTQTNTYQNGFGETDTEPESFIMLECYLRLAAHILERSSKARDWVLSNANSPLHDVVLRLCEQEVSSEVRAGCFRTLGALLGERLPGLDTYMWEAVDNWLYHVKFKSKTIPGLPAAPNSAPSRTEELVFDTIASTFNEAHAFVGLINALVAPDPTATDLNDALPFPELLGASYRNPGMEQYTDFIMNKVFGTKASEIEISQQRILRLACLSFISVCLSTFNEDLVVIANQSDVPVDASLRTSSLISYIRLHPFARVMEWLFSDRVLKSLFEAIHANIDEVAKAQSDSPLVMQLIKSIEVVSLVMKLQATYLTVVRPVIKKHSPTWKDTVANPALASFEDAVLARLEIVTDLGLYCGAGHQALTTVSLALLAKFSSSRKLVVSPNSGFGQRSDRSKIISALEKDDDHERIARAFIHAVAIDERETEVGPDAPGYVTKVGILSFLNSCLAALPNKPTVAHLLLGFKCANNTVQVVDDSPFAIGNSLFHKVLLLAVEYPAHVNLNYLPWLSMVKQLATQILEKLWSSPLSSDLVLAELRTVGYLIPQALKQVPCDMILFDGLPSGDPNFMVTDAAVSYRNFLEERQAYFDYAARELRAAVREGLPTFTARIQSVLFGVSTRPDGAKVPNLTVFALFDFADNGVNKDFGGPSLNILGKLDFSICRRDGLKGVQIYDLRNAEELLALRRNELLGGRQQPGAVVDPNFLGQLEAEIQSVLVYMHGLNQIGELNYAEDKALEAWVRVMTVLAESGQFDDAGTKTAFILQAVQVILPKLERSFNENISASTQLAGFARTLLRSLDFKDSSLDTTRPGDFANDRLFQLFRVSLGGILSMNSTSELREMCYQNCFRYLRGIAATASKGSALSKHAVRTIKAAGDRFIDIICDDAYTGRGTCRISALLLLSAIVALMSQEESRYMLDSFNRHNFVGLLVDGVRHIPVELRQTKVPDIPMLLSSYDTALSLLLRIAQTRVGAASVSNAGLFAAARESQLFSADPDIGLEFENPEALKKFFGLMLSVLRIINAIVLSRGQQNERTIQEAREFLTENRSSIVGVFKRNAGIGMQGKHPESEVLNELVDHFALLMSVTEFLDFEDKNVPRTGRPNVFT